MVVVFTTSITQAGNMDTQALCSALLSGKTRFALVITDPGGRLVSANSAARTLFGLHSGLVGAELTCMFTDRQRHLGLSDSEMQDALVHGGAVETRLYRHAESGIERWFEAELSPLFDAAGAHIGYLRIAQDVNERYLSDETMRRHAGIDQLTGLLNRRAFYEKIDQYVALNARAPKCVILHLIDLDLFKEVNDTLGHASGDAVLREIALRLKSVTRETDYVGRLGGDEFAVLQTGTSSLLEGGYLARKLVTLCGQPVYLHNHEVKLSASIGIATYPDDSRIPAELLRKADLALYRVKSDGRDNYRYFTEALDEKAKRHGEHVAAVREAVRLEQFHLEYQPIMSARDSSIGRAEALLRCDHDLLKDLPILEVLELLRNSGSMFEMSRWIVAQACRDVEAWLAQGDAAVQVAINLCARELSTMDIVAVIETALREYELASKYLSVELTEHDVLDSKGTGLEVIMALRALGISISLDDFGTGCASLEYLTSLPVDVLKLDRTFVVGLPDDAISAKVVVAMIGLAHSLGLRIVAEGVETVRQRDYLLAQTCDELQGFFISAPLNAAAFSGFRARLDAPVRHGS